MNDNPYLNVEPAMGLNSKKSLIAMLGELEGIQPFDDIYISSGRIVSVKSEGRLFWIGSNEITHMNVCNLVNEIGKGQNVSNDVMGGDQKDGRFQITFQEKFLYRYRVNITSRRSGESSGIRISLRTIKDVIPSLDYVSINQDMFKKMVPKQGLVLLVGETGSGKTTTLASLISHIVTTCYGSGFIASYEEPVEFDLENIVTKLLREGSQCSYELHQHEIGIDLPSWGEAIRNAFRCNPDIIILGELREQATIDSALQLALSGHLVFATVHASGAVETISKLVAAFDSSSRDLIRKDFAQAIKGIVCQKLLPKIGGGRVLCRESVFFNEKFKRSVQKSEPAAVMGMIERQLTNEGITFEAAANQLFSDGAISKSELTRILGDENENN